MSAHPLATAKQLSPHTLPYEKAAIPLASKWIGSWKFSISRRPFARRELRRTYDHQAATWTAKLKRLGIQNSYDDVLAQVFANIAQSQNHPLRVLDGGVGAGDLSIALANTLRGSFSLDAFDLSSRMLNEAGRRLSKIGVDANYHQADATRLPFDDNQFDIVMTAHMLEHLADPALALGELVRVLKPGGRLITIVTRRSVLGFGVQLKWRVHAVTPALAARWLSKSGLEDVNCLERQDRTLLDHLSVVSIGQKPHAASTDRKLLDAQEIVQ